MRHDAHAHKMMKTRTVSLLCRKQGRPESAGINKHRVRDERALHVGSS
jgi:hypothetical protein